ncbi:MAG: hypothetical protein WAU77_09785 [Solirubrobacteraceae bacterium]
MTPAHRKRALIVLGIATVAFTVIIEVIDPSHASHGSTILDFEFVVDTGTSESVRGEGCLSRQCLVYVIYVVHCRRKLQQQFFDLDASGREVERHDAGCSRTAAPDGRQTRSAPRAATTARYEPTTHH